MSEELKPVRCGCGGKAIVWNYNNSEGITWSVVYCENCKIQTLKLETEAEAIAAWNRSLGNGDKASPVERTVKVEKVTRVSSVIRTGRCGNCGYDVIDSYKHCPNCGARLEWE